jgi:hypothetical protein
MNGMTMGLRILSRYLWAFKLPSIKYNCVCCPSNCSQVKTLVRMTSTQWASLWRFLTGLCKNYLVLQTNSFINCPDSWSQICEEAGCGGPGLSWLSVVVWLVRRTGKFSKTTLEVAYGRESKIKFSGNNSGGHSYSQHANCTLPQTQRYPWHCVVTKLYILVAFYCPQHKVQL